MKIALAILIMAFVSPLYAQDLSKPVLLRSLSPRTTCDGMKMPIFEIAAEMQKNPGSKGLIVITPDERHPGTAITFQGEVRNAIATKFFGTHIPEVRFASSDTGSTTVALFFEGRDKTAMTLGLATQPIIRNAPKKFFYSESFSEGCSTIQLDQFAGFLRANSGLNTEIVVYDDSQTRRKRTANRWFRSLTRHYKIEPNRIRIFLRKEDHSNGWSTPVTGFWITS